MTDPLRVLFALEGDHQLHQARLLVLLKAFAGRENSGQVEGLTKLAKLDFLLRYPTYLERALEVRQANPQSVKVREAERLSVESRMIRYRYGPWDGRYRQLLNELVGLQMVHVTVEGRKINIGLTEAGFTRSQLVAESSAFEDVDRRSRLLKRHFDLSATRLMNFIYDTFPEIADMRLRQEIEP